MHIEYNNSVSDPAFGVCRDFLSRAHFSSLRLLLFQATRSVADCSDREGGGIAAPTLRSAVAGFTQPAHNT